MSITVGILTGGANSHTTAAEEVNAVATDFISEGTVAAPSNTSGVAPMTSDFSVNAQGTPDMTVAVGTGVAYVTGTPTSQNSQTFRVKNSASSNVTISSNSSGSTKYDWLYIKLDATKLNAPAVGADDVATLVTSRSSSISTDDGTPPTYGYPIAVVTVANGASSIANASIKDLRTQSAVNPASSSAASTWATAGSLPTTVTANGNRSYSVVFNSVDLTGFLSNGMRLKMTRTATAPTLCTDLESSSSQYYSKTTPSGLTFTDDFTCMAWVKLESYTAGGVIARRNADVEGWNLSVNVNGQVHLDALRIAANNSVTTSYQSIPLGKWVHIAATCDLSGTSVLIYIDGVLVPSSTAITGTITALVQGTTALVVGAEKSAGTTPFDGKIAQAAVFSSVLSAATIRSYMSQTLTGAESTNVSAYSFNNSLNDFNANANNLTAQGSAVATATDSPFAGGSVGTTEYGIITAAAFSTNTTLTVQVPEGYAIPTTGGVSAVSYATQKVPYGFPTQEGKWTVATYIKVSTIQNSPVQDTWYNLTSTTAVSGGSVLSVPIGAWRLGYELSCQMVGGAATIMFNTLSIANNTESDTDFTQRAGMATAENILTTMNRHKSLSVAATTPYYLNSKTDQASMTSISNLGASATIVIAAECAYL